jgi:methionyl-tRNA formyltransferase
MDQPLNDNPAPQRQPGSGLRVAFAGTPEFASVALEHLLAAHFEVVLVLSQPDRPAGRGMKLQASPVKQCALAHQLPVAQPRSLRLDGKFPDEAAAAREALLAARPDVLVVAAYGLILPQWVLDLPRLGCLNIHASLLPRWRGAAPIHRAIEAGDTETGITIMQMDAGLDTGDMLVREPLAIAPTDTTASLHDRLARLGGRLMVETLELAACGGLHPVPQPAQGVTYAHKIEKAEALLDWTLPADTLARLVRAFDPFPGASTLWRGESLKIWGAHPDEMFDSKKPNEIKRKGLILFINSLGIGVATGQGTLVLTRLQRAGGKRLSVADFVRGCPVVVGDVLGNVLGNVLGDASGGPAADLPTDHTQPPAA